MRYVRESTLLPCTPADLRLARPVAFEALRTPSLIVFDDTVSNFFFEFGPEEDIELFLRHARFADIEGGVFVSTRENLAEVAGRAAAALPDADAASDTPAPLRFIPEREAFAAIGLGGEFRGRVTICDCGIAGCFPQYAWARDGLCLALLTINGATLAEVAWCPFWFTGHS